MIGSCTWINTFALATLVACASGCQERSAGATPKPNAALQSFVESHAVDNAVGSAQARASERERLVDQVRRLYKEQNYQLIWIDGDQPSKRYRQFVKVIDSAGDHGLPRDRYSTPIESVESGAKIPPEQAPDLDTRVTATFLQYFTHLSGGRLDPHELQPLWTLKPEKPDFVAALSAAIKNQDLNGAMERLQPQQPDYRQLQRALMRYRAIAAKGGWPSIPAGTKLKPNQESAVVPTLRRRLAIEGDLDPAHENDQSAVFDANVSAAVKRFEERHRIEPDGIVNAETVRALNVPVEARIRAIELNLERWRWLPDPMPARYLIVNVPDFRLDAIELYNTAWVHDGGVRFLKDLYEYDRAQAAKLFPAGAGEETDGVEARR